MSGKATGRAQVCERKSVRRANRSDRQSAAGLFPPQHALLGLQLTTPARAKRLGRLQAFSSALGAEGAKVQRSPHALENADLPVVRESRSCALLYLRYHALPEREVLLWPRARSRGRGAKCRPRADEVKRRRGAAHGPAKSVARSHRLASGDFLKTTRKRDRHAASAQASKRSMR